MTSPLDDPTFRLEIFYSYACRDTYVAYRWLQDVQAARHTLALSWKPFAIQLADTHEGWPHSWQEANSELRGFLAAEAARQQGMDSFLRFHDILEEAVHERGLELGEERTLIGAAEQAGLALDRFQAALYSGDLVDRVRSSHERGLQVYGVFGTPTLVFSNGLAFHLELESIPPAAEAEAVFSAIKTLGLQYPYVGQFKHTTPDEAQ